MPSLGVCRLITCFLGPLAFCANLDRNNGISHNSSRRVDRAQFSMDLSRGLSFTSTTITAATRVFTIYIPTRDLSGSVLIQPLTTTITQD